MPAIRTPSMLQQRTTLIVFLVIVGFLVLWQNFGDSAGYTANPVQKFSRARVSDAFDKLDFTHAEAAWSGLQIDSQGGLQIDALTQTALVDAVALLQGPGSESAATRMALLLEKQFGATASHQIMELLPLLKKYKDAEQRWLKENGNRDPPAHAELFRLQDEVLGETLAKQMFSEQRRLANLMLASHRISNDARLTQTQKDQALIELRKTVQEEGAPLE